MRKRLLPITLFVLFTAFAALQLNDPDPWLWLGIYGIVALSALLLSFTKLPSAMLLSVTLLLSFYAATFIPDVFEWIRAGTPDITGYMQADAPLTELMREFFGLCIAVGGSYALYRFNKKSL